MYVSSIPECVAQFCNMPERFVFKKCAPAKKVGFKREKFLVVLEKPALVDIAPFVSNESRTLGDFEYSNFAKYRCNGLIVKIIVSLNDHNLHESVLHWTQFSDQLTLYKVGQLVIPSSFDTNLNEVCAAGIHYFLNPHAAMDYEL